MRGDDAIQRLRLQLQTQFRNVRSCDTFDLYFEIKKFWNFIVSNASLIAAVEVLKKECEDQGQRALDLVDKEHQGTPAFGQSKSHAAFCAFLLPLISNQDDQDLPSYICMKYGKHTDDIAFIARYCIEPLYDYLDNSFDDRSAVLSALIDFKKRVEWFDHDIMLGKYTQDTTKGEITLAWEMYRYLFDRGIPLTIEPASASGSADMILHQGKKPLIADAKIFKDNKAAIISGYNQLYQYLGDFNETVGYLVIFNVSEMNLSFEGEFEKNLIPAYSRNGKTIYFLEIRLREITISASKQGKMQTVTVNSTELQIDKEA